MSAFDYLSDTAKLFFGVAISLALVCVGVALLADYFGVLTQ